METKLIAGPVDEPLLLGEVRAHLREPEVTTDAELLEMIAVAREQAEHKLGRSLLTQTWEAYADSFPAAVLCTPCSYRPSFIELPMPPLQSVTSITYLDSAGVSTVLPTTEYVVDASGLLGRIRLAYNKSWPTSRGDMNNVVIRYVAGYTSPDAIPANIKHWMKLFIEAADKNRSLLQEREPFLTPFAEGLLDRYRLVSV